MMYFHIWWIGALVSLLGTWVFFQWKMAKDDFEIDGDDAAWFFVFCMIWPFTVFAITVISTIVGVVKLFTRQILFRSKSK